MQKVPRCNPTKKERKILLTKRCKNCWQSEEMRLGSNDLIAWLWQCQIQMLNLTWKPQKTVNYSKNSESSLKAPVKHAKRKLEPNRVLVGGRMEDSVQKKTSLAHISWAADGSCLPPHTSILACRQTETNSGFQFMLKHTEHLGCAFQRPWSQNGNTNKLTLPLDQHQVGWPKCKHFSYC